MLQIEESMNHLGDYDVIVIGAGHAGIEAAHAAAMLGAKTAVFTMSLDAIGNMPCNPSIGGTAKGTLVRELDALGGVMGLAADATYLQSRMLNKGKGPAVHALRVQTDRKRYHEYMKHALELTPGLAIHQAEIVSIEVEDGHVKGVVTQLNGEYGAKAGSPRPPRRSSPLAPTSAEKFLWAMHGTLPAPTGCTRPTPSPRA